MPDDHFGVCDSLNPDYLHSRDRSQNPHQRSAPLDLRHHLRRVACNRHGQYRHDLGIARHRPVNRYSRPDGRGDFSLSALLWAFSSPFWARASDRYGRKPLMMIGLSGFMVSMAVCAVVVAFGLRHMATPVIIFVCFLLARALFGLFGAASNPATQAYVAEHTPLEQRTQSMSSLAGAFGLGTVIGPFIAPLFVLPFIGLAGPMAGFSLIAAGMLYVVWRYLPESQHRPEWTPPPKEVDGVKVKPMWRDPRLTPFLIYGFIVAVCQTAQGQTLGFLIIDKLKCRPPRPRASSPWP